MDFVDEEFLHKKINNKYLGVLLDEHMSWNEQIHQIKLKLNRAIGILNKLRSHANLNTLRVWYYSLFQSQLQYGVQLWGQKNKKKLKKQCRNSKVVLSEKLILKNFTIL